ncbi:MAG: hypothetical protein K6E16_00385 [Lachnospiraceae bacterium]|nr:hypothetical protein [Lachnospiraceae bacterium]
MHLKWILLSIKWNLKSITFWMLPLSLLLLLLLLHYLSLKHEDSNLVLFETGGSKKAEAVMDQLMRDPYHGFDLERAESEESLREAVYRSEALGGVIFTEDFDAAIETGEMRESVLLLSPPDSTVSIVLRELLFPCILENSSPAMLSSYLKEYSHAPSEDSYRTVMENNSRLIDTWDIGLFRLTEVDVKTKTPGALRSFGLPVCILLHLLVFVLTIFEEKKLHKGFLTACRKWDGFRFLLESAAVRTLLLALCVILGNAMSGNQLF